MKIQINKYPSLAFPRAILNRGNLKNRPTAMKGKVKLRKP